MEMRAAPVTKFRKDQPFRPLLPGESAGRGAGRRSSNGLLVTRHRTSAPLKASSTFPRNMGCLP